MNHKIAIPVINGRLCAHFGHCSHFFIADIKEGKLAGTAELVPPPHAPGVIPKWLGEQGVTVVMAGGVGQKAIDIFGQYNIEPIIGVAEKPPQELINDFLNQQLESGINQCDH